MIVGGHSHSLLSNAEAGALGPHPTVAPGGRLVVQAGAYRRYLGRLGLDSDADGRVLACGGECRHVGLDLPQDPAVAAVVAGYAAPLQAVRRRMVAHLPAGLDAAGCRFAACALGEVVAQALLDAAPGAEAALMNAGGLRAGLRAGPVTLVDVLEALPVQALPFGDALATLRLRGADLAAAVEYGFTQIGRGAFPHLAGLRRAWEADRSPRAGPMGLLARGPDGAWAPLDPAREYGLFTHDFLRRGGDGYAVPRDRAIEPYDAGPGVAELVADALGRMAPPRARWRRRPPLRAGGAPRPARPSRRPGRGETAGARTGGPCGPGSPCPPGLGTGLGPGLGTARRPIRRGQTATVSVWPRTTSCNPVTTASAASERGSVKARLSPSRATAWGSSAPP